MKIISWNIRGLSSAVKKRFVNSLLKERKPDILLIQETKVEQMEDFHVKKLWYDTELEYAVVNANGLSGGIITIWSLNAWVAEEVISTKNFLLIRGVCKANFPCIIVNIYAPNNYVERRAIWGELVSLKERFQVPWCLGGDFNEIKGIGERLGCTRSDRGMREFQNFISEMEIHLV
ncbi:hypothetical protein Vadar_031605 [Vaccinium darrowii]|uniref:Uncharacterized protein n=1 Tax=Vaccinium darrowii TaxID=229202 RepID=A0ACB7Z8C0_9ERIC|nr:hypothetical protein Vadar_031605 [Vaccinium darrowii]